MGVQKVSHSSIASLVMVLENVGELGLKPKHLSKTQIQHLIKWSDSLIGMFIITI